MSLVTILNRVVGNKAAAATDAGNPVKIGGVFNSTQPTYTNGQRGDAQIDTNGALRTVLGFDGSAVRPGREADNGDAIATTATSQMLQISARNRVFNGSSWDRQRGDTTGTYTISKPTTSGGYTIYRNIDMQSTGISVKGSAGQVYGWYITNNASSVRYVKLYNKATAATVGTDTPVMTIPIPANAAANVEYGTGIAFSLGISIGAVTGVADANTGAPTANDVIVNLFYN